MIERELKYVVDKIPQSFNKVLKIRQYYFRPSKSSKLISKLFPEAMDIRTYRLRIIDDKAILTLKTEGILSRNEYEKEVDQEIKELILSDEITSEIIKNRYFYYFDNYTVELDEYLNLKNKLLTAEVEYFSDDISYHKKNIESILVNNLDLEISDVSFDFRYKNSNLHQFF